eukprot:COSAG02_NODE_3576_length_6538_cov_3.358907_6_plen_86_part_00
MWTGDANIDQMLIALPDNRLDMLYLSNLFSNGSFCTRNRNSATCKETISEIFAANRQRLDVFGTAFPPVRAAATYTAALRSGSTR